LSDRIDIRVARDSDLELIFSWIVELAEYERGRHEVTASEDDLHRALFAGQPAVFAHVAEDAGEAAGFALWFLSFSTWLGRHGIYLEDLYVRPELRGHGYGAALLAELARICVERGYARLQWSVLDWNQPSIDFYRRLGAKPLDEWTVYRLEDEALLRLASGASHPLE
jgi:GNAT superfamily N-acetyltransferase